MTKSPMREPTYRVYAVSRRRTRLACWMDIGTAITHKDGKGFDLELQSVPLTAEELVVRTAAECILPNGAIAGKRNLSRRNSGRSLSGDTPSTHAYL